MTWLDSLLAWLNGFAVVGDAVVTAIGTALGATVAVLTGVWTYAANRRREVERSEAERRAERDRIETEQRAERDRIDRQREERIGDIVRALHAEILTGIVLYEDQITPAEVQHTIFDPTPFSTPDETDFVFESVKADLSILPSDVIHSVVAYYRAALQTNFMIRDFREERFYAMMPSEKQRFMEGYIELVWVLKKRGDEAVAALADYAKRQSIDLKKAERRVRTITRTAMAEAGEAIAKALALGPG
jgi:hypothetical protein